MMKKLFLMSAVAAVAVSNASAQTLVRQNNVKEKMSVVKMTPATTTPTGARSTMKTTATAPRNYDHATYAENSSLDAFSGASLILWQDSTVKQNFTTGLGTINFSSVAQVISPFDAIWNDEFNDNFKGLAAITKTNSYNVDSVSIQGLYVLGNDAGSASIVDTLEISVGYQPQAAPYYWTGTAIPELKPYLPSGQDTFLAVMPRNVNTDRKYIQSQPTTGTTVTWREILPASSRISLGGGTISFTNFAYKLPSVLTVPAGNVVVVSYTFRSGATWVANVDTVTQHNHFRPGFSFPGSTTSKKQDYKYYSGDHNGSSINFSTSDIYLPTVMIGAINDPTNWFNQYLLNTVTLSCATCNPVGIKETSVASIQNAFPNPANTELSVPFTVKENATVTVSISNILGQVISTQNMGKLNAGQSATAKFNTSNLSAGVYMYTVEANGQRSTERFSVAH